jgi:hypothetical protein
LGGLRIQLRHHLLDIGAGVPFRLDLRDVDIRPLVRRKVPLNFGVGFHFILQEGRQLPLWLRSAERLFAGFETGVVVTNYRK